MATSNSTGFSYAQAAKGRAQTTKSQTPPSHANITGSTPAATVTLERNGTGNWADDVEANGADIIQPPTKLDTETSEETSAAKDSITERAILEIKASNAISVTSSPDLGAASSTTTREDDSSVAANGSQSESTWETKSQSSDPAWIAERKERQNIDLPKNDDNAGDSVSALTSTPAPRPAVLQDAPLPVVNPWLKRAQETKARLSTSAPPARQPAATTAAKIETTKESAKPANEDGKKADTTSNVPSSAAEILAPKPADNKKQQKQKTMYDNATTGGTTKSSAPTRANQSHNSSPPPPSVKDEISWPTPELAAEKERRDIPDKDKDADKVDDAAVSSTKTKKKEWTSMVVTPNIIFETQNIRGRDIPRGSERGGRGGLRGRGNARGGAYAADRAAHAKDDDRVDTRGQSDRDATTITPKPTPVSGAATDAAKEPRDADADSRNKKITPVGSEGIAQADSTVQTTDTQRAQSPKSSNAASSASTERARATDKTSKVTSDAAVVNGAEAVLTQSLSSESRKETRPSDGSRETANHGATRGGGKRSGRGRGGSREFTNGHPTGNAFVNGHSMEFGAGHSALAMPSSPSGFPGPRGSHSFSHASQGRGGWPRGAARTPSLPMDGGFYQQRFSPYGPAAQLTPIQTYYPNMYDMQGYPMSAFQSYPDQQYLIDLVTPQLEYYFCTDNLLKDMFLRKNMDSQGFVFLDVIANFNRIKQLMADKDILRICCMNSETIEICVGDDGKERMRKREGWAQFVLPMDQRNEGAQTNGPQRLQKPERPQLSNPNHLSFRGPVSAGPHARGDRRSYDASAMGMNDYPPQWAAGFVPGQEVYADLANGDGVRGRAAKSNVHENGSTTPLATDAAEEKDSEPDAFPDEQTSALTVVVKTNQPRVSTHPSASRTFSNGSIDSRSIFSEMGRRPSEGAVATTTNGESAVSKGTSAVSRGASPSKARVGDSEISLFWMKDQSLPSDLPSDVSLEPYTALRLKALDQRSHAATGTCPYDLDVLYQFWCHFLIRNFNSRMYSEFKYFASEDAKQRHSFVGLQSLIKFFAQALLSHNPIRDRILRDYVELVNTEPAKLDSSAFKQLRSAWRNGALNLKNRKKLTDLVDPTLKERLEA